MPIWRNLAGPLWLSCPVGYKINFSFFFFEKIPWADKWKMDTFLLIRSNRSWTLAKRSSIWKRRGFAWLLWGPGPSFLPFSHHRADSRLLIGWTRRPTRPVSSSTAWLSTLAADCWSPSRFRNRARLTVKRSNEPFAPPWPWLISKRSEAGTWLLLSYPKSIF